MPRSRLLPSISPCRAKANVPRGPAARHGASSVPRDCQTGGGARGGQGPRMVPSALQRARRANGAGAWLLQAASELGGHPGVGASWCGGRGADTRPQQLPHPPLAHLSPRGGGGSGAGAGGAMLPGGAVAATESCARWGALSGGLHPLLPPQGSSLSPPCSHHAASSPCPLGWWARKGAKQLPYPTHPPRRGVPSTPLPRGPTGMGGGD